VFKDNNDLVDNTHEWCADGVSSQIDNLKDIHIDTALPWFGEHIHKGKVFHVPAVSSLPPDAYREKEHFEAQSIKSLLVIPMISGGKLIGFLGFDAVQALRTWSEDEQIRLRLVTDNFVHALERRDWEKA
jgi:GAF domain-containing protein